MNTVEDVLFWLRKESKLSEELSTIVSEYAASSGDEEEWDASRLLLGESLAYQRAIKSIRGLSEREFQLAKKRNSL